VQTPLREWDGRRTVKELEERRRRTTLIFQIGLTSEAEFRDAVTVIEA
jgi:hypothetical protein